MKKIDTAIRINNVKINSIELFRHYFDFKDIYELLKKDCYLYQSFVESVFPPFIRLMLFGRNATDGSRCRQSPVDLLSSPEKCSDYYPLYFKKAADSDCVVINIDMFSEYIGKLYECVSLDNDGGHLCADWPSAGDFQKSVNQLLDNISAGGNKKFSSEGAVALYIYLLLHIQAAVLPDVPSSYEQLNHILEQNIPMDTQIEKNIVIKEDTDYFQVGSLYKEEPEEKGMIELVRITNRSLVQITVFIADSILRREILPGDSVYALRKAGRYISFLPRFSVFGDTLLLIENGRLCTLWNGNTSYLDTTVESPVCWAHSNEYGTFIIDENGHLDENNAWPKQMPSGSVRSVSVYGVDYCMLLEDGSVTARLPKNGWNNILFASIGLNSGIAIDSRRIPLLPDGSELPFADAVEAYAMESHYICLDSKGKIITDSNLSVPETVYAVAICEKGYILAQQNKLSLISFCNSELQEWTNISSAEIAASNEIIACRDGKSGQIKRLEI